MSERPDYYILSDRIPFAVDRDTWVKWWGANLGNRHVGDETIGKVRISTAFVGRDHNFSAVGDPLVFETMIFGGPLDGEQWRYSTWAEAERGHTEAVVQVRKAAAQIKAIKDKAT